MVCPYSPHIISESFDRYSGQARPRLDKRRPHPHDLKPPTSSPPPDPLWSLALVDASDLRQGAVYSVKSDILRTSPLQDLRSFAEHSESLPSVSPCHPYGPSVLTPRMHPKTAPPPPTTNAPTVAPGGPAKRAPAKPPDAAPQDPNWIAPAPHCTIAVPSPSGPNQVIGWCSWDLAQSLDLLGLDARNPLLDEAWRLLPWQARTD